MDQFNSRHFAFFIVATTVVSLKTYPTVYTINGMRDSWVAMIIASILILLYMIFCIKVYQNHKGTGFYEIYTTALGKSLGTLLIFLFLVTLFFTLVESAAVHANAMHTNMLIETPIWYFLLFFVVPTLYTVRRGLAPVVIVTLIGIVLVTISGINLAILTVKHKHAAYLFPIFENGITGGFILSILQILGLYGSITLIFPYLTEIKTTKKLLRHSIIGLIFVIQMQLVTLTGLIQTFGIEVVNEMVYPNLLQTQLVTYFRYLEAGELFVMLQVVGGWYLKYIITFYGLLIILKSMGYKGNWIPFFIAALVGICAFFAANNLLVLLRLLNYYTYIAFINLFLIPFFVFALFSIRQKKETKKAKS
ncbi:spore germination protein (amino acid permease) [Natronincola peptidivorans]|uniref:Spore germination protein (Amino acid permease) n=1 Tax=Natronincola peptidivorans TaxID=426128 RepID=A0A1I0AIV6_9FIRM|nr:endospore germination permease [Natronincola peptidivorans]SES94260.1 spore germination protein (amino acid permease) [Natronincola peptidivorans]